MHRLAYVMADLPVVLLGRIRSDRVLRLPKSPRPAAATGRPPEHGPEFRLDDPDTWPPPQHHAIADRVRTGVPSHGDW
ncbi:hypothetical protein Pen02_56610 [Plantactinospora endophytica]|uniref:Transposase IS701-like DDE domain-containing protein n=1 Tax=Plantactinospora endophytica TaxID=673535 RepID=A0ABQ4E7S9_9ACTN|nr:hypothetical protein Pen02_56610 [Plantactinospora endophytica]